MSTIPKPSGPDIDIGHQFLTISWTLYSIATIVVVLRLYAQATVNRKLGWDDALMVVSLLFGISSGVMLTIAHHYGFGRHFFYLTPSERVISQKFTFINEPLGIAGSAFGRLSFMALMYRLFGTTKYRRWFIIFLMTQTIIINLVTAITIFTQCPDVRSLWDPVNFPGKCWSPLVQEYTGFFQGSCNAATDLTLTILPGYIFWSLQLTTQVKLGLASLMCLSVFAFIASLVKVILLKSLGERSDYTFNTVPFFTWINVENTLVIIAASIPMIRPLFTRAPKPTSSYEMNNKYNSRSLGKGYALSSTPHVRRGTGKFDNSSEEVILPVQGNGESGAIVKTIAITVKEDEERAIGGDGYERRSVVENGWSVGKKV